jgi:S-DNA-T family DNA segregation ATPase FtsK/SpoIIIE
MKPLRLVSTPTRNRRLNEILGLVLLVAAALLLLALATYTPTDPSADTVGNYATGAHASAGLAARLAAGPAHNWTGLAGAWLADLILQTIGIAAFFLPIVLGRLGLCWMRQRPAGSPMARLLGLGLWIVFAPAAVGLLPRTLFWRHALPIEGVTGRLLADAMVHYLNLPGASTPPASGWKRTSPWCAASLIACTTGACAAPWPAPKNAPCVSTSP